LKKVDGVWVLEKGIDFHHERQRASLFSWSVVGLNGRGSSCGNNTIYRDISTVSATLALLHSFSLEKSHDWKPENWRGELGPDSNGLEAKPLFSFFFFFAPSGDRASMFEIARPGNEGTLNNSGAAMTVPSATPLELSISLNDPWQTDDAGMMITLQWHFAERALPRSVHDAARSAGYK
jgi:hypothetical protein